MPLVTLKDILAPAMAEGYAVAGVVCLGWEDARAYVAAAEAEGAPIILQAGPGARAHMPLTIWGAMFRELAEGASVPIATHLDHGASIEDAKAAIDQGFSSVMFDGSRLSLDENIQQTAEIAALAHDAGVSCEGEIGFVGYHDGEASDGTDPDEAKRFVAETGVDAVAVSVGNVHLQENSATRIDRDRLSEIEAVVDVPLVIHGGSGIDHDQRAQLAGETKICKFNIGTELRQVFGASLRQALADDPKLYDRVGILSQTHEPLVEATRRVIGSLRFG